MKSKFFYRFCNIFPGFCQKTPYFSMFSRSGPVFPGFPGAVGTLRGGGCHTAFFLRVAQLYHDVVTSSPSHYIMETEVCTYILTDGYRLLSRARATKHQRPIDVCIIQSVRDTKKPNSKYHNTESNTVIERHNFSYCVKLFHGCDTRTTHTPRCRRFRR